LKREEKAQRGRGLPCDVRRDSDEPLFRFASQAGTSAFPELFVRWGKGGNMPSFEEDQAAAQYEAYEQPPTNTYLACFGLFMFSGIGAIFYVLLTGV
jgi:hypothetical protein